jgi:hypothetical protein
MKHIIFFLIMAPALLRAQHSKQDSIWLPMQPFFGEWTGQGKSESGVGTYERSYEKILKGNFIEVRNKSSYPPSASNPKGEVHKDVGYISYDKSRKRFVLRQFHTEGFVNTYYLESISPDNKTLVFLTEAIENIPEGWRARETYRILSADEIEETFELAEPGGEFFEYSKVKLLRKQ